MVKGTGHSLQNRFFDRFATSLLMLALGSEAFADAMPFELDQRGHETEMQRHAPEILRIGGAYIDPLQSTLSAPKYYRRMTLMPADMKQKADVLRKYHTDQLAWITEEFVDEGNWDKANEIIQKAIYLLPSDEALNVRAGYINLKRGRYKQAARHFERALWAQPRNPAYLTGWADAQMWMGNYTDAEAALDKALSRSHYFAASYHQTVLYIMMNETDKTSWDSWSNAQLIQIQDYIHWLIDNKPAIDSLMSETQFSQCIKEPLNIKGGWTELEALNNQLITMTEAYRNQDWTKAMRAAAQLIRSRFNNIWPYMILAEASFNEGNIKRSTIVLQAARKHFPTSYQVWFNSALFALKTEDYEGASIHLRNALRLEPGKGDAMFALCCAYAGMGQDQAAWPLIRQLAVNQPKELIRWLEGNEPYLTIIKSRPWFRNISFLIKQDN
ncbi:MAG: tetratricopeptide repeat protein [Spartobacteria bacterium]|nr:tetratricopeptide repeat protein [Spartobacteria bacterium]